MHYETLEEQIDELDIQIGYLDMDFDAIECKKDPDEFCEYCEAMETIYEPLDYFGAPCFRPEDTCPTDFCPGDVGCHRADEYGELVEAQAEILRELKQLQAKFDALRKEVA